MLLYINTHEHPHHPYLSSSRVIDSSNVAIWAFKLFVSCSIFVSVSLRVWRSSSKTCTNNGEWIRGKKVNSCYTFSVSWLFWIRNMLLSSKDLKITSNWSDLVKYIGMLIIGAGGVILLLLLLALDVTAAPSIKSAQSYKMHNKGMLGHIPKEEGCCSSTRFGGAVLIYCELDGEMIESRHNFHFKKICFWFYYLRLWDYFTVNFTVHIL